MPEITRYLRVFPAPYLCFDHVGRPAGAFPHEPKFDGGAPADDAVHHVGASRVVGRLLRKAAGNLTAHHEHLFHFGAQPEGAPASEVPVDKSRGPGDPILVENSEYYRKAVKTHQLYAADLETWETAGGDPRLFIDPHLKQLHAIEGLQASHVAHYGKPSPYLAAHWQDHHAATRAKHFPGQAPAPQAPAVDGNVALHADHDEVK